MPTARTLLLTVVAMVAFAANSILCRLALGHGLIDAASFASLRLASGAITLMLLLLARERGVTWPTPNWPSAAWLFVYAACFAFAYRSLGAGTGALILFGVVQLTMFGAALTRQERFTVPSWAGLALAFGGLLYLLLPGVTAPDTVGGLLMAAAGAAWGLYSLRGRGATDPLATTAANFLYAVPPTLRVSIIFLRNVAISAEGLLLAVASGALASGCGYVIWYAALRGLSATRAATVQLSVPVIAGFGGVLLLSEPLTPRLIIAAVATIGGVAIVLSQRATAAAR